MANTTAARNWARRAGLAVVVVWFLVGGIAHLALTEVFVRVMPSYVPLGREVVLATGVCEIIGALALLSARWRRPAGWALMAFCLCVMPVHIEMLRHAERYRSIGAPLLWARIFLQPLFIWLIWVVTAPPRPAPRIARL